jgi:hypothetical protein
MNLISKGVEWFEARRQRHCVETVTIKTASSELTVLASVVEPESEVNATGVKVRANTYVFLINHATIASLDISRGVRIFRKGQMYEVVIERNLLTDFNDPDNKVIALQTQLRPYVIN